MKHAFKRLTALIMIMVFTCISLIGCTKHTQKNDIRKITLNEVAHSIFYAPQYVAIEKGYFKDEGIDLTLVTGFGADKVMTALISGDADIGFMGSEASVYIYTGGSSDYAVNFAQLTQRAGNFLVSRDNISNFKWSDVKGKTIIGGRAGGMPQMLLEYILKKNNIDCKKDVEIVQNIDFGSTAAAFASGLGDFTVEFEPSATAIESENKGYIAASLGVDSGYVPYTAYCAKKSFIENNSKTIESITRAIYKGQVWVKAHSAREVAEKIQSYFPGTSVESIEKSVQAYKDIDAWNSTPVLKKEAFDKLQLIMTEAGELKQKAPYDKIVNNSFAEKVIK